MKNKLKNITFSAICLALCILLPYFTGNIPQIGSALSPMHIPVLLCGLVCGFPYGMLIGAVAPVLRSLITGGFPPLFPSAIAMTFELAAYGAASALIYKLLPKKTPFLYVSLISSMLIGRIVWGIAMFAIMGISGGAFTLSAFMAGAFIDALPGIICHIAIVPVLAIAIKKSGLWGKEK